MAGFVKGVRHETTPKITADLSMLVENARRFALTDKDLFEDADATADTVRWSSDYAVGTEGGSADINTTTAGKLMVAVDPDASPTAAVYAVTHTDPIYSRYYQTMVDLDTTWGVQTSGTADAGIMITKGAAYDATNYLWVGRYKTSGTDVIRVDGKINNVAILSGTPADAAITDDVIALKIERLGAEYRFYYSTSQSDVEEWTFIDSIEDASNYLTNKTTVMLFAQSSGGNNDNSVVGDFDNWKLYLSDEGVDELIGIVGRDNSDNAFATTNVAADIDGTIVERLESIQKALQLVDAAAADGFEEDGTGGTLYSYFNSTDANANIFTGDGGVSYNDNLFSFLKVLSTYVADGDGDFATGQALPSNTSLVDIIGDFTGAHDGTAYDDNIYAQLKILGKYVADGDGDYATGTILAANKSLVDALGQNGTDVTVTPDRNAAALQERIDALSTVLQIVDAAGANGFEEDGTGGTLYSMFNSTDANGNVFTGDGGLTYDDNIFSFLKTLSTYIADGDGDFAAGTALPSDVSLYDTIKHLRHLADGGTNVYPDGVVQDSIMAYILSKDDPAVTTSYSNATDSLEALSDKLGAWTADEGTDYNDSVFAFLTKLSKSIAGGDGDLAANTELPANKSLYDILWVDRYTDAGNTTGLTCTAAMSTNETDIATLTNGTALTGTTRRKVTYWLDMTNIDADAGGGNCTIRVKAKIDESNYRTLDTITWVNGTSDNGVTIEIPPFHHNLQVTFQMSIALAGDVAVPYRIVTENMEY